MILLAIGLFLWCAVHWLKRLAPGLRAGMDTSLGAGKAKSAIAAAIAVSLVLIIIGYRQAGFIAIYTPPPWTIHLNNLLMIGAVALVGASHSKGRVRTWFRHPMLLGVALWAVSHLIVNGDLASLLLFGTFVVWALASIALINNQDGPWQPPSAGPLKKDMILVGITVVVYLVLAGVHTWLGYWPFPG
ncbi:MAG: NnrU family protein [Pseudomonadota bacterium]